MKLKIINYNLLITLFYVLLLALFKHNIITYMFFVIIFILELFYLLKKQYKNIVYQMILLIPLLGITTIDKIPFANAYSLIFALYILLFENKYGHSKKLLMIFLTFVGIDFIKYILFFNNINGWVNLLSVPAFYLSIYASIVSYEIIMNEKRIIDFANRFVEGTFLSILYGFITRLLSNGILFAIINNNIFTRNSGASGDPNYFGLYICISIAILLIRAKNQEKKFTNYILMFLFAFLGMSSSSRMYYVILLFLLFVIIIHFLRNLFSKNVFKTLVMLVIILVAVLLLKNYFSSNIDYLLYRNTSSSDITNGRSTLINVYNNYMDSNIFKQLIGIGIPQYNVRAGFSLYAHNLYVELYVTQGIFGIIIISFASIIRLLKKRKDISLLGFILLLVFLIGGLGVNFIEIDSFYILFVIVLCCMKRRNLYE